MHSQTVNELTTALAKAQADIENATMDRENSYFHSRYATLASVRDAIRAPLSKNGLSVTQTMEVGESGFLLVTTLWHSSGQWIRSEYPLPTSAKPQEMGSAVTYARRYALAAMVCNSSDEDDDGQGAQKAGQKNEIGIRAPKPPAPAASAPPPPVIDPNPHVIVTLPLHGGGFDWVAFAREFKDSAESSKDAETADKWLALNKTAIAQMKTDAPKIYKKLTDFLTGVYPNGLDA